MMKPFPRNTYNLHALRVLEYNRIREIVSAHADSEEGRLQLSAMSPVRDGGAVRELLAEVDELMQAVSFDDPLPNITINNIRKLFPLLKIKGYNLGIENCAAVADNLECARFIKRYFEERNEKYPVLWSIVRLLTPCEDIEKHIRKVIKSDLTIADDASHELRSIRRKLTRARDSLRELVEKTLAGLPDDIVAERIVTIRSGRFVIPVRYSMKKRVQGAVHDRSQTGKTLFIEPLASIEANNLVSELEMAERAEIERILVELTASIALVNDDIAYNQDVLVRLDVIKAKARYGVTVEGIIPEINSEPVLRIRKGRHPLLDWKYRNQNDGSTVVPLDFEIGDSYVTIVLTGPNAGGKTVALKTAGLLAVMALSGMPVPAAQGTVVFPLSDIFADIGDEQSIEDDLSTFSSHMRQIVTILREAGPGSLVLLDELGGGTNPSDGESIALAVLKKLTGTGALSIATTHHGGLKVFAHETRNVINASMEFDSVNLKPAFALRTGVPGSSYAFEIAGRMGMPADILKDAESYAGSESKSLEGLISEMKEHERRADEERKATISERELLETAREKIEKKLADISKKKNELLNEALDESKKIVENANRRIESAVKIIRERNASREAIIEAQSKVKQVKKDIKKAAVKLPKKKKGKTPARELKTGLPVWVESLGVHAVIEEVLDRGEKARIHAGRSGVSVIVNAEDLFESDMPGKKREQVVLVKMSVNGVDSNEIDLRGMTFDEARTQLDSFLDRLSISGIETAHIIHGKGSGVLRSKISGYLDKNEYVDSHRPGNWNEGSTGVTVVKLK